MTKQKANTMTKQKAKTAPILLLADYWGEDGRCPAGKVIDLPIADAKALIADGKAERADPMPGDD